MSIETSFALDASILAEALGSPDIQDREGERLVDSGSLSEEVLTRQIQAGCHDLLAHLVRKHSNNLFAVILRMVQSYSTAEDILQNTWVRVVHKFHQYDSSLPLKPWLTRIALNCCRDYWRREQLNRLWKRSSHYEKPNGSGIELTEDSLKGVDDQIEISKALSTLSPKLREVVVLKFYSGFTHDEIADVLRVPAGTIKSRLSYALSALRKYFDDKGEAR